MNIVSMVGRLYNDPTVSASNETTIARFGIAVDRRGKDKGADFINCVAFNKTAEFIEKYFRKGSKIGLVGHIQTGSYTNKENKKVYTTDVIVDQVEFVESKKDEEPKSAPDEFVSVPDGIDDELPFA